jgi:hypothetical protein
MAMPTPSIGIAAMAMAAFGLASARCSASNSRAAASARSPSGRQIIVTRRGQIRYAIRRSRGAALSRPVWKAHNGWPTGRAPRFSPQLTGKGGSREAFEFRPCDSAQGATIASHCRAPRRWSIQDPHAANRHQGSAACRIAQTGRDMLGARRADPALRLAEGAARFRPLAISTACITGWAGMRSAIVGSPAVTALATGSAGLQRQHQRQRPGQKASPASPPAVEARKSVPPLRDRAHGRSAD